LLEYGYNRDGDSLPQINLSLILDKDKGIPVMYDLFPGSISDVSTLSVFADSILIPLFKETPIRF